MCSSISPIESSHCIAKVAGSCNPLALQDHWIWLKTRVNLCTKRHVIVVFGTFYHKKFIPTSVVGRNSVGVALKVRSRCWIYWISTKTVTSEKWYSCNLEGPGAAYASTDVSDGIEPFSTPVRELVAVLGCTRCPKGTQARRNAAVI